MLPSTINPLAITSRIYCSFNRLMQAVSFKTKLSCVPHHRSSHHFPIGVRYYKFNLRATQLTRSTYRPLLVLKVQGVPWLQSPIIRGFEKCTCFRISKQNFRRARHHFVPTLALQWMNATSQNTDIEVQELLTRDCSPIWRARASQPVYYRADRSYFLKTS